jgi:hypothetical protein
MATAKVLPGNETVLLVPAYEVLGVPHLMGATLDPISAPKVATLNRWQAVVAPNSANAGAGGNISCAIRDDLSLGLTDSDTDSDRTICSVGQSEDLTFYNFDAELATFRHEDVNDKTGVFSLAKDLTRAADIPYIIVHRIGYPSTTPFAVGQEVDLYYALTDNPVPEYDDGSNQLVAQTMVPKNLVNIAYALAA